MNISEVIKKLEDLKEKHGDISVRIASSHDYWGTLYVDVDEHTLRVDKMVSTNPKKMSNETSVVFCSSYDC